MPELRNVRTSRSSHQGTKTCKTGKIRKTHETRRTRTDPRTNNKVQDRRQELETVKEFKSLDGSPAMMTTTSRQ
jgi:hypothetical protein